jgi:hypothetical protein
MKNRTDLEFFLAILWFSPAFFCCFRGHLRIRGESGGIMPMNIINAG